MILTSRPILLVVWQCCSFCVTHLTPGTYGTSHNLHFLHVVNIFKELQHLFPCSPYTFPPPQCTRHIPRRHAMLNFLDLSERWAVEMKNCLQQDEFWDAQSSLPRCCAEYRNGKIRCNGDRNGLYIVRMVCCHEVKRKYWNLPYIFVHIAFL